MSRRKHSKQTATVQPLPPHLGNECPTCPGASFVAVNGVERCNKCGQPLPTTTARRFSLFWGWMVSDRMVIG